MREIKFRAWSKGGKKMYPVNELAHPTKTGFDTIGIEDTWMEGDEYELMQYTGLKDKNGVEIYEGDILEIDYTDTTDNDIRTGYVEYYKDMFLVVIEEFDSRGFGTKKDRKVIGNIYENQELLK